MALNIIKFGTKTLVVLLIASITSWTEVESAGAELSGKDSGNLLQYRHGDILLAGLMRVHRRGNETCSEIQDDGIQAVETMNMVIDKINKDEKILKNITLGTIMVDTCDVDSHALQRVVIDILPLIWNVSKMSSSANGERPEISTPLIAGVVGAASSAVSIQVANLLQVFEIPQVSYWSTSPDLSDKDRYKYFFRTVPSDTNQASAMIAMAKEMNWNYISVVYENDFYGVRGFTEIKELAAKQEICIATSESVPRNPTKQDFVNIVRKLLEKTARAIIVFTKRNDASELMIAAQEMGGETSEFIWIGSDGWSGQLPLEEQENELSDAAISGSIGFTPKTSHLEDFDKYFTSITLEENQKPKNFRNPWFAEYISKKNNCLLGPVSKPGERNCSSRESVDANNFVHLTKMENVADSVLAFAYALDAYHKDKCGGVPGMCAAISNLAGTNQLATGLYDYLKNLNFTGINGENLQFDKNQDGPALYNILSYKPKEGTTRSSRLRNWMQAGSYSNGKIVWEERLPDKVWGTQSICSKPCGIGQAKITGTEICCWHCQVCHRDEYVSANGTECLKCPVGSKPASNQTTCNQVPVKELNYDSVYGIACICVGSFGLICTLVVTGIYIRFRDTAIVKASGRELCFFVLFGVFLTFLNFLSMTASPTTESCVVSRILLAIGPTFMYAGLLTKTVRVVIIFQSKTILSERVKMFIRPWPQIVWSLGLVLLQVIVVGIWFGINVSKVKILNPTNDTAFRACAELVDIPILIGLIYPFLLIIICTILATVNRNVPTGFNETQYIGFSMYTTCVIWLAFLPIFITNPTDLALRIMTTSICLSLSATTVLFCLFGPRCFTILFHPEENTQQSVMSTGLDKGGRPGSLPATKASNSRGSNSISNCNNNNGSVWRNGSSQELPRKSSTGYSNGALTTELSPNHYVEKQYPMPEFTSVELTGGEDTEL